MTSRVIGTYGIRVNNFRERMDVSVSMVEPGESRIDEVMVVIGANQVTIRREQWKQLTEFVELCLGSWA